MFDRKKLIIFLACIFVLTMIIAIPMLAKYAETMELSVGLSIDGKNVIQSVEVVQKPDRTTQWHGSAFDRTGMVVQVNYTDGTSAVVDNYMIPDGEKLIEGQTSVTIHYEENGSSASTTQTISVCVAPGLYQTGAVAAYREGGAAAVEGMLITSWENLIANNKINVEDGTVFTEENYGPPSNSSSDALGGDLILPLDGSVTALGNDTFHHCVKLTGVFLPDTITALPQKAFHGCKALTELIIPESITSIGSFCFADCDSLASISIPNSVTQIGNQIFEYCDNLQTVKLSESISEIPFNSFYYCSALKEIKVPDGVLTIDIGAFGACESLMCIRLPDSLTYIHSDAFENPTTAEGVWYSQTYGTAYDMTATTFPTGVADTYLTEAPTPTAYLFANGVDGTGKTLYTLEFFNNPISEEQSKKAVETYTGWHIEKYKGGAQPWYDKLSAITTVIIHEKVDPIFMDYWFYNGSVTSITVPSSLTHFGNFWLSTPENLLWVNKATNQAYTSCDEFPTKTAATYTLMNDIFLVGNINGANVGCEEDYESHGYSFFNNKRIMTFTQDSYVFLKTLGNANWYMTEGWLGTEVTSAQMFNTNSGLENADKLFVPAGTYEFTVDKNDDDSYTLSYEKLDHYLVGYINGADHGIGQDAANMGSYKFEDGKVNISVTGDTYVYVKLTDNKVIYMTDGWLGTDTTSATLYDAEELDEPDKLFLPKGNWELVLTPNADGSLTLSCNSKEKFLVGFINGGNYGCEENAGVTGNHKFVDGKVTVLFTSDSYVFMKIGDNSAWYMTDGWQGTEVTSATLHKSDTIDSPDKLFVPAGLYEFSLVDNGDDTFDLSYSKKDCYLVGYIDGTDYGINGDAQNNGDLMFVDGKVSVSFTSDSFVCVKTTDNGAYFMTDGWQGTEKNSVTLHNSNTISNGDKLFVPAGSYDFFLTENPDGTLTISYRSNEMFLVGSINGANVGCEENTESTGNYKFKDGKVTAYITSDSYVFMKIGDNSALYMTDGDPGEVTSVTLHESGSVSSPDKLFVPAGLYEFTLTDNGDGTYELSYTEIALHLVGYINGSNYGSEEDAANPGELKFVDGKLTTTFTSDSYIYVKSADNSYQFMTDGWQGTDKNSVLLLENSSITNGDKMFVPAGTYDFFLAQNPDGTLSLSWKSKDKFLVGFINGSNYGCEEDAESTGDYKFVNGKVTVHLTADSYVFMKIGDNSALYMTDGDPGEVTSVTLHDSGTVGSPDKLFVPAGTYEFTLVDNGDGTYNLSYASQDYYLVGYINGSDYGINGDAQNTGELKFVDGRVTATFTSGSYVYVKTADNGRHYMTDGWQGMDKNTVTLYDSTTITTEDKLFVPAGTYEFFLTENDDGTFELSWKSKEKFLVGFINGANYGCEEDEESTGNFQFVNGKVTAFFSSDSYVFMKIGDNSALYMTDGDQGEVTSVTLHESGSVSSPDKLFVPAGLYEFNLADNGDGTYQLSYTEIALHLVGYINGTDYGCNADAQNPGELKFVDGKLTATFTSGSYVYVKAANNTYHFMTDGWQGTDAKVVTLYDSTTIDSGDKMFVPEGTHEFTLIYNADGTLTLSCNSMDKFLVGQINGKNHGCEENAAATGDYRFQDGKVTAYFTSDSYVFMKIGDNSAMYMTDGNQGEVTSVTLHESGSVNSPDKLFVPAGLYEFTLADNGDGTYELSYTKLDLHLVGYINGADYGCNGDAQNPGELKFVDGKLTATFTEGSYVYVKTANNAYHFMTYGWQGMDTRSVPLHNSENIANGDKLFVPAGTYDFTLVENGDGTLQLTYADPQILDYYLVGFINGKDVGCGSDENNMTEYKFVDDKLTVTVTTDSYVYLKMTNNLHWYMTDGWQGTETTSVILHDLESKPANPDKLFVPTGVIEFTLTHNDDGTKTLSYTREDLPIPDGYVSYTATIHFNSNGNWSNANLYAWLNSGTSLAGAWPGTDMGAMTNGEFTATISYNAPVGEPLNLILNNGSQKTKDLFIPAEDFTDNQVEKWITLTNYNGLVYDVEILDTAPAYPTAYLYDEGTDANGDPMYSIVFAPDHLSADPSKTLIRTYAGDGSDGTSPWMTAQYADGQQPWYQYMGNIRSITIMDGVTPAHTDYWFYNALNTTSLTIGNGLTSIGRYTFYNCSGITGNLTIPENIIRIGDYAFNNVKNLDSISIPASVTSIGAKAFSNPSGGGQLWCAASDSTVYDMTTTMFPTGKADTYTVAAPLAITISVPDWTESISYTVNGIVSGGSGDYTSLMVNGSPVTINQDGTWSAEISLTGLEIEAIVTDSKGKTASASVNYEKLSVKNANKADIGYSASITDLVIPATFLHENGTYYKVTELYGNRYSSERLFEGCTHLTSIRLPDSLEIIGDHVFSSCSGLTGTLTIPESVKQIGKSAFALCTGFTGPLTIPDSVTSIGDSAFSGCSGFTGNLTISNNITRIEHNTFENCSGLTGSLILPDGITAIGYSAFQNCSGFTGTLTIPNTVTLLESSAFRNCSGLSGTLIIPGSITSIGVACFQDCAGLNDAVIISDGVTSIENSVFYNVKNIDSISIPASVTTIGTEAFSNPSGGDQVWYATSDGTAYNMNAQKFPTGKADTYTTTKPLNVTISVPDRTESITFTVNGTVSGGSGEYTSLMVNGTPATINQDGTWSAEISLTGLEIEAVVTDTTGADKSAKVTYVQSFISINNRGSIGYTDTTTDLGIPATYSFGGGIHAKVVGIENADSYNDGAFASCSNLVSVTFPDSLQSIGDKAFANCANLVSVTFPDSMQSIGNEAFVGCSGLTGSLIIPDGVTSIGDAAFAGCSNLDSITLPASVMSIGQHAFINPSTGDRMWYSEANGTAYDMNITMFPTGKADTYTPTKPLNVTISVPDRTESITFTVNGTVSGGSGEYTSLMVNGTPATINQDGSWSAEISLTGLEIEAVVTDSTGHTGSKSLSYQEFCITRENRGDIGYTDEITSLTIPATFLHADGTYYKVTSTITSYSGPYYSAFGRNENLKSVYLPDSLTTIGGYTFYECSKLQLISIPASVTSFGTTAITNPMVGDKVWYAMSDNSVYNCATTVTIPTGKADVYVADTNLAKPLSISISVPDRTESITYTVTGTVSGGSGEYTSLMVNGTPATINQDRTWSAEISLTGLEIEAIVTDSMGQTASTSVSYQEFSITAKNRTDIGYTAETTELVIPATFLHENGNYYKVINIPSPGPEAGAFANCTQLTSVTLPNSLTNIGYHAFYMCTGLTGDLIIPDSVTTIGTRAFYKCSNLNGTLTIGNGVTSIGNEAFSNCSGLTGTLVIPDGVIDIQPSAFYGCQNFDRIVMPASVSSIGSNAFTNPSGKNMVWYAESDGTTYDMDIQMFPTGKADTYIAATAPISITLNVPDRTESITFTVNGTVSGGSGEYTSLMVNGTPATINQDGTWSAEISLTGLEIEAVVTDTDGKSASAAVTYMEGTITRSNDIGVSINSTSINIPATFLHTNGSYYKVVEIGDPPSGSSSGVFEGYLATSLTLPDSLTTIGSRAFYNCKSLCGDLNIPDSVVKINDNAFTNCTGFTGTLRLPQNLTFLGSGVFTNCGFSGDLVIPGSLKTINILTFKDCSNINGSIIISDGVQNIYSNAFGGITKITSIEIPASVTRIDMSAFDNPAGYDQVWYSQKNGDAYIMPDSDYDTDPTHSTFPTGIADVYVADANLTSPLDYIVVSKLPAKTVYNHGDLFNPNGMEITAYFESGASKIITDYTITTGQNGIATKLDQSDTLLYQYTGNRRFLKAYDGEALVSTFIWNNGSGKEWFGPLLVGRTPESVAYYVESPSLAAKYFASQGSFTYQNETWYFAGSNYNQPYAGPPTGNPPLVNGYLNTSSFSAKIQEAALALVSNYYGNRVGYGQNEVEITYTLNGITESAAIPITVNDRVISIAVTTKPSKLEYVQGEFFDPSGMVVKAIYASGTTKNLATGEYEVLNSNTALTTADTLKTVHYTAPDGTGWQRYVGITVYPSLSVTINVPDRTESITYSVNGTVSGGSGEYTSLMVNGIPATINQDGTWSAELSLTGLEITAVLTDSTGHTGSETLNYKEFKISQSNRGDIGYTDDATVIDIPATFLHTNGTYYKVTEISDGSSLENGAFVGSTATSLKLPNSLRKIGAYAFNGCSGLTGSLTIPNSVISIGKFAFNSCTGFNGTLNLGTSLQTLGLCAFQQCTGFTGDLTIPNGVSVIQENTFFRCSGFNGTLTIPNSVNSIEVQAFSFCSGLTGNLVIPNSVVTIEGNAFQSCYGFKGKLILSENLTSIGGAAFFNCYGFTGDLIIPDSVTTIENYAFEKCYGFNGNLKLPNSALSIGKGAFSACYGFTGDLTIPDNVLVLEEEAFKECYGFTGNLTIGGGITTIGLNAFYKCTGFAGDLIIKNGVTTIASGAFAVCANFNSISLPASVTSIGGSAFTAPNSTDAVWYSSTTGIAYDAVETTFPTGVADTYVRTKPNTTAAFLAAKPGNGQDTTNGTGEIPDDSNGIPQESTSETVESAVSYRNPLTGEERDTAFTRRPYAVVINNIKAALPQHGVNNAAVIYEMLAEGGITRTLAIYDSIGDKTIGSIRSARPYIVDLAQAYDAILVHAGASSEGYDAIYSTGISHLDALLDTGDHFYRNQERLDAGIAYEHTLFSTGSNIVAYAKELGISRYRDSIDYGLQFADSLDLDGSSATNVTIQFSNSKNTSLTYNESRGVYYAYQNGETYVDGNSSSAVTFKNVLILRVPTSGDGDRLTMDLTGSGEGYFACNGQMVQIKWHRESAGQPFSYSLEDGTPIELGIGSTYIALVPMGAAITVH